MTHLSLNERLSLIEDECRPDHPHLAGCARCREEVAAGRAVLTDAGRVGVPEPSPLFWDHFSWRVSEQIAAAAPEPVRARWASWRVLVPLAVGVSVLILTVAIGRGPVSRQASAPQTVPIAETGDGSAGLLVDDQQWLVLSHLAGEFDLETLSDSLGKSGASGAESAVWQLNEQERAELAVLLRAAMQQGSSGS
jgi:hypothetical protein